MSKSVDERIVEMRFNNAQFEKNVQTSINTLDKLNSALKLDGASKGLDDVGKATKGLDPSILSIANSVGALEKRFSTLGIIGMEVVKKLTNVAMDFVGGAMHKLTDSIISGGIRRAQNIENAHFQLQGLLKDEQLVQGVMADAMDSVDGTAYGYDEAAKAASMFAASGLRAGEQMQASLRAITGVAAMTNSEYSNIADIFTTVAGNGRLMGDQLLQLSSRGMNAASTIKDYFNGVADGTIDANENIKKTITSLGKYREGTQFTEAAIRKMVSDGKLSFEIFANAMDDAFGEHAKKANETFNGALANMRAALSRIGAKFVGPLIEQNGAIVELFNTIRQRFNDVNKQIDPFANKFVYTVKEMARYASDFLDSDWMKHKISESMPKLFKIFDNLVISAQFGLKNLGIVLKAAGDGLHKFIPYDILGKLVEFTDKLRFMSATLHISDEAMANLKRTFQGVGAIFHIIAMAIEAVIRVIGTFSGQISGAAGSILDFSGGIGDALVKLDNYLKTNDVFYNAIMKVITVLGNAKAKVDSFIKSVTGLDGISGIFSKIKDAVVGAFESLKNFKKVTISKPDLSGLESFITKIKDRFKELTELPDKAFALLREKLASTKTIQMNPELLKYIDTIKKMVWDLAKGIKDAFAGKGYDFFHDLFNGGIIATITASIAILTGHLGKLQKSAGQAMKMFANNGILGRNGIFGANGIFGNVGPGVQNVLNQTSRCIQQFTKSIKADVLKKIATALAILAGSLVALSLIDSKKLTNSLGAVTVMLLELVGVMKVLDTVLSKSTIGKTEGIKELFGGIIKSFSDAATQLIKAKAMKSLMIGFAASIAILAGALFIISSIDKEKLVGAVGAITALIGELVSATLILTNFSGQSKVASAGLIIFAVSIGILASALKKIAEIDPDRLGNALISLSAIMAGLVTSCIILSNFSGKMTQSALGVIAFALAVKILASAVADLGALKPEELTRGLAGLGVVLAELAAFMVASTFTKFKASQGLAIIELSAALLILQHAVSGFGTMDVNALKQGLAGIGIMLAEIAAFNFVSGLSKHVLSTATSLVIISAALLILGKAVAEMGAINPDSIVNGLVGIGVALAEIVIAVNLMPKNILGISIGLLLVSTALKTIGDIFMNLSGMSWEEVGRGLLALGGSLGVLTAALYLMKGAMAGVMVLSAASTAILLLVPAMKALGSMSLEQIGLALLAIAGAFTVVGVAGALIGPLAPMILALAGALAVLGVAMLACGAGMTLFATGLATLAVSGVAGMKAFLVIVGDMITGIARVIKERANAIGEAFTAVIIMLVDVLKNSLPAIIEGVFAMVDQLLITLRDHLPSIVDSALTIVSDLINSLAEHMPEFIPKLVDAIKNLIAGVIEGVKSVVGKIQVADPKELAEILFHVGVMAAVLVAMAALAMLAPAAAAGIIAFGGLMIELTAVLAAVGAINKIPGLQQFVDSGGDLLQSVGEAIGKFVGGFLGEAIAGVVSKLPKMAQELSMFMVAVMPFLAGANSIKPEMLDGVMSLAKAVIVLTAADFISGIVSFFTGGGSSLVDLGKELAEFAPYFKSFADSIKGIDPEVVVASATAAESLAKMASTLPNSGGLAGKIFGENSLSEFGKELETFGPHIKQYGENVAGLDSSAVEASAAAASIMADMASKLPNNGGLAGKIFGENSLAQFGEELASFGPHIKQYGQDVAGLDSEAVEASAAAAQIMADLATKLPNSGGLAAKIFGDNSISKFGEELKKFGGFITEYSITISGLNLVAMNSAMTEIQKLVALANDISAIDTSAYSNFAQSLQTMANNGIDGFVSTFQNSSAKAQEAVNSLITNTMSAINALLPNILQTGTIAGQQIDTGLIFGMNNFSGNVISTATKVCTDLINVFKTQIIQQIWNNLAQIQIMQALINGLLAKKPLLITTATKICTDLVNVFKKILLVSVFMAFGRDNVMQALITGMESKKTALMTLAKHICEDLVNIFKEKLSAKVFSEIGKGAMDGLISSFKDEEAVFKLKNSVKEICELMIETFKEYTSGDNSQFVEIGKQIDAGLAKGIIESKGEVIDAVKKVVKEAVEAAKKKSEEKSPSKVFARIGKYFDLGMAQGINDNADSVVEASSNLSQSAIDIMRNSIKRVSDIVDGELEYSPTITPVLDLSNIQNGSKRLRGLVTKGLDTSVAYGRALAAAPNVRQNSASSMMGEGNDGSVVSNNYNFTQNNYSPKALSRKEIYRQTRNQFSMFKGAVSGV